MVPPEDGSVVVGVKAKVSFTPTLFSTRSRGSMMAFAVETAETSGSSRSCSAVAAAMKRTRDCIPELRRNENLFKFNG